MWPTIETFTWIIEVGYRVARHTQTMPRDERWFAGLRWQR